MTASEICDTFIDGTKACVFAMLLVGLSRCISVIMTNANIIDTVVYGISEAIKQFPSDLFPAGMLII